MSRKITDIIIGLLMGLITVTSIMCRKAPVDNPVDAYIIVFNGESNSGGLASNSSATAAELASRNLRILNNTTLVFEPLEIGVNNLIGHEHLEYAQQTSHGWELELANQYDAGRLGTKEVYLVKTGQGGSTISEWDIGGPYWSRMTARVNATIQTLTEQSKTYKIVFWYTHGINDYSLGTTPDTFKAGALAHINAIRSQYGSSTPFLITELMTSYASWNPMLNSLATEAGNAYTISAVGAEVAPDLSHWTYQGMKLIANRMIDKTIALLQ